MARTTVSWPSLSSAALAAAKAREGVIAAPRALEGRRPTASSLIWLRGRPPVGPRDCDAQSPHRRPLTGTPLRGASPASGRRRSMEHIQDDDRCPQHASERPETETGVSQAFAPGRQALGPQGGATWRRRARGDRGDSDHGRCDQHGVRGWGGAPRPQGLRRGRPEAPAWQERARHRGRQRSGGPGPNRWTDSGGSRPCRLSGRSSGDSVQTPAPDATVQRPRAPFRPTGRPACQERSAPRSSRRRSRARSTTRASRPGTRAPARDPAGPPRPGSPGGPARRPGAR